MKNEPTKLNPENHADDLLIVELDERMEFSAGLIESDLEGEGVNVDGCLNGPSPCSAPNTVSCANYSACC